ncbi:MAG TPA: hypothetical protein VHZ03_35280 [Trebonia sp.]|nr:hypothetical protein [Trebonia sp.]
MVAPVACIFRRQCDQPLAAFSFDVGGAGRLQVALQQVIQLASRRRPKPRPSVVGRVVEREQQAPRLGVDHGQGVPAVHGHLGQPRFELGHPLHRIPSPQPGRPAGQLHLVQQRQGDPADVGGSGLAEMVGAMLLQVRLEIGREHTEAGIAFRGQRGPSRHRVHGDRGDRAILGSGRRTHHVAGEDGRLGQLLRIKAVGLVQDHERRHGQFADPAQQISFTGRYRRIAGQHEDRRVHGFQRVVSGLGVPGVDRAGAGSVHQFNPAHQHRGVDVNDHAVDATPVPGVSPLGHQVIQRGQAVALVAAIGEGRLRPRLVTVADRRCHRGERRYPGREHGPAQQRVDQCALTALRFASDKDS